VSVSQPAAVGHDSDLVRRGDILVTINKSI